MYRDVYAEETDPGSDTIEEKIYPAFTVAVIREVCKFRLSKELIVIGQGVVLWGEGFSSCGVERDPGD